MVKETRKIWGDQHVDITATCIRVPIMRAHAESINLELEREMTEEEVSPGPTTPANSTWQDHRPHMVHADLYHFMLTKL